MMRPPPPPRHQCRGWPEGHYCPLQIDLDRDYCNGCIDKRRQAIAEGIPPSGMLPVGVVLEDFNAPRLACKCGGDPTAPDHEHSLTHMRWAWTSGPANAHLQPVRPAPLPVLHRAREAIPGERPTSDRCPPRDRHGRILPKGGLQTAQDGVSSAESDTDAEAKENR